MQKLKRNINMGFRVTESEQEKIRQRMEQAGIRNLRAYLLKQAIDGMIVTLDLSDVKECSRLLGNISGNINQIAKRTNQNSIVYATDIEDIKARLGEIWGQQDKIIKSLAKILEVLGCRI